LACIVYILLFPIEYTWLPVVEGSSSTDVPSPGVGVLNRRGIWKVGSWTCVRA
jgi:hypothetical protein